MSDLPPGTWVEVSPEVSSPSSYVDSRGDMKVKLVVQVFSAAGSFRIDLDELLIRFTAN